MNVKELKEFLKDLPDEMPVGLLDMTTDDFTDCNYPVNKDNLIIDDCVKEEGEDVSGKMLFITFENSLNENPI